MTAPVPTTAIESFIARWQGVTASELATAQSFVIDCYRCGCFVLEAKILKVSLRMTAPAAP